jgi:uncharacterized protein (DUF342 family)
MTHPPLKKIKNAAFHEALVEFLLSSDEIKLFVSVTYPESKTEPSQIPEDAYSGNKFLSFIKNIFPQSALHEEVIFSIAEDIRNKKNITERRIVKGVLAQNGEDGKLIFLARKITVSSSLLDLEKVRNVLDFENILTGRIVARVYPPKNGTPGVNALGKPIKATAGKPYQAKIDKTLKRATSGTFDTLTALNEGIFVDDNGTLTVLNELSIRGDLSAHFGVIEFIGSITISGSLQQKASIRAKKGVIVKGDVSREVFIASSEGNIEVLGVIENDSRILCAGLCTAKRLQGAYVEARQGITVLKDAILSTLKTHGTADFSKGKFLSGSMLCGKSSIFQELGNEAEGTVRIQLSTDIEATKEYQELLEHLHSAEKLRELLELQLGPFAQYPNRIGALKLEAQTKMNHLLSKLKAVVESILTLQKQRVVFEKKSKEQAETPIDLSVTVSQNLFSGTIISINTLKWECKDTLKGPIVVLSKDGKEISIEKG